MHRSMFLLSFKEIQMDDGPKNLMGDHKGSLQPFQAWQELGLAVIDLFLLYL